jgi:prevent-host-death family protein
MTILGAFEAKTHLASLLDRVERGEEITITKHGRAVARLVPVVRTAPSHTRQIIERLKAARKTRRLGSLNAKALISQGRR